MANAIVGTGKSEIYRQVWQTEDPGRSWIPPSFRDHRLFSLRPSTDRMRPTHTMEGNMLYSKSTDSNVNLQKYLTATFRLVFKWKLGTMTWPSWHIKLNITFAFHIGGVFFTLGVTTVWQAHPTQCLRHPTPTPALHFQRREFTSSLGTWVKT